MFEGVDASGDDANNAMGMQAVLGNQRFLVVRRTTTDSRAAIAASSDPASDSAEIWRYVILGNESSGTGGITRYELRLAELGNRPHVLMWQSNLICTWDDGGTSCYINVAELI